MIEQGRDKLIQKKRFGVVSISFSSIAFTVLCVYLAMIALCYVEWIPTNLVSLSLYGFVALSVVAICVAGKLSIATYSIWYACFLGICAFSCMYSTKSSVSVHMVKEMLKILLFSVTFMTSVNTEKRIRTAISCIMLSTVFLFFYLSVTGKLDVENRMGQDLTGNANTFASIFMIGAFCSVYFVYFSEKKIYKLLAFVAFLLQLYAISLSGSRKFFLMPVVLLGVLKLFSTDRNGRKKLISNTLITVTVLLATWWALFNVEFLYDTIGYRMEGMVAAITGEGEADASSKVRMEMIEKGIELWLESPLLGHGIDTYKAISGFYGYSHNNYAELLSNVGLIGTVVYYFYAPSMAWRIGKRKRMGMQRWYWVIALACLLIFDYGAVTYNMYIVQVILLLVNASLIVDQQQGKRID